MIRWLPSTGFFLTLVLLWLALNNTLAPGHIVMAILVGIVVPWVVRPMFTDENAPEPLRNSRRYLFAAWLGLRLLRDIVSANLVVASKILFAREASLSPTLVSVDLRLQSSIIRLGLLPFPQRLQLVPQGVALDNQLLQLFGDVD